VPLSFGPKKLTQKLILSLTIILVMMGAAAGMMHMKVQEQQLLDAMVLGADQLSGSIVSATWFSMLADQRQAAYEVMNTIAQKQGISRIRIFNKEGRVMFSTVPGDSGQVDKEAEACSMCHSSDRPLVKVDVPSRSRVFHTADGKRRLGIITPIYNEPSCSNADCHVHPVSQSVLGVLDVSLDLAPVDEQVAGIKKRVLLITGSLVIVVGIFIVYFTRHFVDAPIRKLIAGTRAVSAMQLDEPVVIHSSEELGELAKSFDTMRLQLKHALDELNRFTEELESKVEDRTQQLNVAHKKLVQNDKLASLGQLAASVAHEINNPLSGVLNLSMLMQRILKDDGIPVQRVEEFRKYLSQVTNETARVGRIVQDLLAFSRRSKPQRSMHDLNRIIASTVSLISHKLHLMKVSIDLDLEEKLPALSCDSSQLQQVLINLIMNGGEASQGKRDAKVVVRTAHNPAEHQIILSVSDNGDGISESNIPRIFDPFFTTKEDGKGVGLGLAVVYGIVNEHMGDIEVQSKPGGGTTFIVRLPEQSGKEDQGPVVAPTGQMV
jgi:two-component system NtrC family sensor kinase